MIDPALTALLLHPERWTLVATGLPLRSARVSTSRKRWIARRSRPHSHAEILMAVRGRTAYGLAGRFVPVRPGTVVLFRPLEPHQSGYPRDEAALEHLGFSLMRDHFTVRRVLVEKGRWYSTLLAGGAVAWSLPNWMAVPREDESQDWLAFRLRQVVMTLAEAVLMAKDVPAGPRASHEMRRAIIHSIQCHLEQTAGRGDTLESLARIAGYSPFHFHRLFTRGTGCRLHDFINRCRLQRVRARQGEGWTPRAIAEELGFSSPQAFSRWRHRFGPALKNF